MIYGLIAGLSWGGADLIAAVFSRSQGVARTVLYSHIAALVLYTVALVATRPSMEEVLVLDFVVLGGVGILLAVGYHSFYRGMVVGPIAIVAPIAGANAVVPVGLSVLLLSEHLSVAAGVSIALLIGGVALAQAGPSQNKAQRFEGVVLAGITLITIGITSFAVGYYSRRLGWLLPMFAIRVGAVASLVALTRADRRSGAGSWTGKVIAAVIGIGILDNIAYSSFALGTEQGDVSIVSAVASLHPVVPVVGAIVLLRERVLALQLLGATVVVGALILLGLST